jgi:hypothetical protein
MTWRLNTENRAVLVIAGLCLVSVWFSLVVLNTPHAPRADDFDLVLNSLVKAAECESLTGKLAVFFSPHNEHRPALIRLISWALSSGFGSVNLVLLAAIGNMFLILLVLVLYAASNLKPGLAFLPVLLILFNFQHFDTSTWAAGVCHYGFLLFSISAIYLSCGESKAAFALSLLSLLVAMFCLSGAIIAAMVCLVVQAYLKRSFRAVFMMIFMLALLCSHYFASQESYHVGSLLGSPEETFTFFLLFLGGFFSQSSVHLLSPLAGQAIFVHFCYATVWQKYYKINIRLYSMFLFSVLLAVLVSVSRVHCGLPEAISSRYKIYSLLTLAIAYLTLLECVSAHQLKRFVFVAVCISAVFFVYINIQFYPTMVYCKQVCDEKFQSWVSGKKPLDYPDHERAERICIKAISLGIYKFN